MKLNNSLMLVGCLMFLGCSRDSANNLSSVDKSGCAKISVPGGECSTELLGFWNSPEGSMEFYDDGLVSFKGGRRDGACWAYKLLSDRRIRVYAMGGNIEASINKSGNIVFENATYSRAKPSTK